MDTSPFYWPFASVGFRGMASPGYGTRHVCVKMDGYAETMQQLRHHARSQISENYGTQVLYNAPYFSPPTFPTISSRSGQHSSSSGATERAGAPEKLQLETVSIAGRGIRAESGSKAAVCLGVS